MSNEKTSKVNTLAKWSETRWFWIVLSVLLAFLFWLYVASTEAVEIERNISGIKVEFLGEEALREGNGLVVTEQSCNKVDLRVSGSRRVINKLSSSNMKAVIDLTNIIHDGSYTVSYSLTYPSGINSEDVRVVSSSTDIVSYYVDVFTTVNVEIRAEFTGTVADGFMADNNIVFSPVFLEVGGPRKLVSQIDYALVSITRDDVSKTIQFDTPYTLIDKYGEPISSNAISCAQDEVNVTMNVLTVKQVPLVVSCVYGSGAVNGENTVLNIEPATVSLAGTAEVMASVNSIELGTVDFTTFTKEATYTFPIEIPESTENISGSNNAIVTASVENLSVHTFTIERDHLICRNVPEGVDYEIMTKSLPIVLRGTESAIDMLAQEQISGTIDVGDVMISSTGTVVYLPVQIEIHNVQNIGPIGEYKVYISLTK